MLLWLFDHDSDKLISKEDVHKLIKMTWHGFKVIRKKPEFKDEFGLFSELKPIVEPQVFEHNFNFPKRRGRGEGDVGDAGAVFSAVVSVLRLQTFFILPNVPDELNQINQNTSKFRNDDTTREKINKRRKWNSHG